MSFASVGLEKGTWLHAGPEEVYRYYLESIQGIYSNSNTSLELTQLLFGITVFFVLFCFNLLDWAVTSRLLMDSFALPARPIPRGHRLWVCQRLGTAK